MLKYFLRRTLWLVPVFFGVTLITSVLIYLLPGHPFSSENLSPELQTQMRAAYGLDQPWYIRYFVYVANLLRGDWGYSFQQLGRPVSTIIGEHVGYSLLLAFIAIITTALAGIPLGVVAALNHNRFFDYLATSVALLLYAIPGFVIGIAALLLILVANNTFGWTIPLTRMQPSPLDLLVPGIILGIRPASIITRLTRASMLEILGQDYIRTAKAKGLAPLPLLVRHALKNSLIPVVTVLGDEFGALVVGSVTIETVFAIPGMGTYLVESIRSRDYPMILAITTLYAMLVVCVNLIVDIIYGLLDPRIKDRIRRPAR
jgi:oligopeptide transport system permease protein